MGRKKEPGPTPKQMEVYRFLVGHICEHGYQPSRKEMADVFNIGINAINGRLTQLERHGLLKITGADRAIELVGYRWEPRATN